VSDVAGAGWPGDDFFGELDAQDGDGMIEMMAQEVAERARDAGLPSADDIEIDSGLALGPLPIDVERVRRRANDILAGR
jgi:hypothetical protein